MNKLTLILILFPFIGLAQLSLEQESKIESIKQTIETAEHDSIIVKSWKAWDNIIYAYDIELDLALNQKIDSLCSQNLETDLNEEEKMFFKNAKSTALNVIGIIYKSQGDYPKAIEYQNSSLKIKEEIGDKKGIGISLNNLANIYKELGEFDIAIEYNEQSLKIREEIDDKTGIAASLNNLGIIYKERGDYVKAIDHYTRSLKIYEEAENKRGVAYSLFNIGNIYYYQGDVEKALDYYNQSLEINQEIPDQNGIATSLLSIGNVYQDDGDFEKALDFYHRCLEINKEINDKRSIANTLNNIGAIHRELGDYDKAIDYYNQSINIKEETGDKKGMAISFNGLAAVYKKKGDFQKASQYSKKALLLMEGIGSVVEIRDIAMSLWESSKKVGDFKTSLEMHELYITMRDSIASIENQKEIIRQEYKYEYDKQSMSDSLEFVKQQELDELAYQGELDKEANQRYGLYGGLAFLFLLGTVVFRSYYRKKKDNIMITTQKEEVEEQKREIMDSITYAKRIQDAILPPTKLIKRLLPDSFVLYKPKDIVAGDFYWIEEVNETIIFAAADCTGHGVPGAMVSVVCHNAMNRSVREFGLLDPGKILDKTKELVIRTFEKSEKVVRDGMDVALCTLNGNNLNYAGANNPLWIIRNGEILETKATKQPVGKVDKSNPFVSHNIKVEKGDSIYIFSDGYVDQFGGERGKKFKPQAFRELLLSVQTQTMGKQKEIIDENFETWRGDIEQIDDVCVIGIKI